MQKINGFQVTYKSSPNIALIKYWGKYHEEYILPINDSLGLTLNQDDFHTITTIKFGKQFSEDSLLLNETIYPISKRLKKLFKIVRQKAFQKDKSKFLESQWNSYHFNVVSKNSFPTASGMASSASGLACLASALNGLFENILNEIQLSELARLGSGSACRSIHGGLVRWKGVDNICLKNKNPSQQQLQKLSKQCISFSTKNSSQLSYIKIICLLATNKEKQTSSTTGMQQSVNTSELINFRNEITLKRIDKIHQLLSQIQKYRAQKNKKEQHQAFNKFVQIIIKDSNQFHAICLDTYPPIFYLNQFSKMVMNMVDHTINKSSQLKIAYTFDAGPHAFLFVHQDNLNSVFKYFQKTLKIQNEQLNQKGKKLLHLIQNQVIDDIQGTYKGQYFKPYAMWVTDVGEGCQRIQV